MVRKRAKDRYASKYSAVLTCPEILANLRPAAPRAVRKIFGRRSRHSISQFPPPHAYHRSEPLSPQPELPEPPMDDAIVQRVLSTSYFADRPGFSRTTSPYALQFPNSVSLKPMDLSNQLTSTPTALRRRKTLPSMLAAEACTADATDTEPVPGLGNMREESTMNAKQDRRKSRSADDLQAAPARDQSLPRKRSAEIRYWRDNLQSEVQSSSRDQAAMTRPNVSRGSERPRSTQEREEEDQPMVFISPSSEQYDVPSKPATVKSSPSQHRGPATFVNDDTEMSRDLEDRVAKLEAGLQNFQKSLQKLTADRNRRTIVMGGSITARGSSGDMRTPSLLADTLADALEPSGYEYEYGHTLRPSPQPPLSASVQGRAEDPFGPDPPVPRSSSTTHAGPLSRHAPTPSRPAELRSEPERPPTPHTTSATMAAVTPGTNGSSGTAKPQQYTFRSLYEMLADERSARRKLESQLKGLRQEISDLHTQVNSTTTMQSTRSSYMLAGTSSRLQDLLRETEEGNPPDASPRSLQRQSAISGQSSGCAPVISRFSGSDSEVLTQDFSQDYDDFDTPYEAYRTPREERSKWSLADTDIDMF